jgi:hypothetical protein
MNSEANAKVADIITGIFKHIEVNSDADTAYDTAGEYAVRIGWGCSRPSPAAWPAPRNPPRPKC